MGKNLWELPIECSTLVELVRRRAQEQPKHRTYSFLVDGEVEGPSLTYGELDCQARAIGSLLQSRGVIRGERALLLYPAGLEFIAAFFGCLYAGIVAVPAYPPRANQSVSRLQAVVADAQATIALTTTTILPHIERQFLQYPNLQNLQLLATDNIIANNLARAWQEPSVNSDTLAFLQYTSGSTGTPKGVMVSHGNLLHNEFLIKQGMQHTTETLFVGWLPLFHDMGLVGNMLQPLYLGIPCILMSPVAFLQKPFRWLQAISRYKGTTSGGPNFAYDLCVQKITPEQRATLDLSSWEVAFNGAEPIRAETLEQFAATFAKCGFRAQAFYPCYGMAETTLIVSGGLKTSPPVLLPVQSAALAQNQVIPASPQELGVQTLVGCGQPLQDLKIAIVDPETLTNCHSHEVGEIWVAGKSVTKGYWNHKEQTEHTFQAYLKDTRVGPFLRTGDLGFLREGELFITGRLKDLIIIRGQNHYPQDIEWTVEQSHPALQPTGGAAFSIDVGGEERLVIVQEIKRNYRRNLNVDEVIAAIRSRVAENHELQVYAVSLLKTSSIPKTSSGKTQRHACRAAFLAGSLESIASNILEDFYTPVSTANLNKEALLALEKENQQQKLVFYLQEQVAQVLKLALSQVNPQQSLSALGLDSLMAIEIKHTIETNFGVVLPITSFLEGSNINKLATEVLAQLTPNLANSSPQALKGVVGDEESLSSDSTEYPLSYGQQALYFLHRLAPESPAYNIAKAVRICSDLNIKALHRAFQILLDRHSCLRTTFSTVDGEPIQRVHEQIKVCFQQEDAATWDEELLRDRLIAEAYRPFNLEQGPLWRVSLFTRSPQEYILLLVVHHIVADLWSLTVLVDELGTLYHAEKNGTPVTLPSLTWQYADYVRSASQRLASKEGEELLTYWQKQLAGELPVLNLPTDRPRPPIQTYRGASYGCKLSPELTRKLKDFSRDRGVTLYMTMLAAFQVLLYRYTGQEDLLVGSPTTGRGRADLAGLVGYFVNPIVCRANLSSHPTFDEFLSQVRSYVLDAFNHQDYPLARLVEQLQPVRDPSRSPLFQVMFVLQKAHLRGQEGLASFALEETGARIKLGELELESIALDKRIAQFDLTLMIAEVDEVLSTCWEYNTDLFDATTIARMAGHFQTLLENIVIDSQQRVSVVPFLTQLERQQLLLEWNATQVNYTNKPCLHKQFEAQVEQTPNAVAVVFEEERITYQELNQRANQLANYLQTLGVEQEVLVGIYLERSIEMVVSILAVLKAGGAYVPLDPTYPKERIAFMLEDAQVSVLLTQQEFLEALPEHKAQVVCLDKDSETLFQESVDNPVNKVTVNNLAYVIYTSGSTGKPKGVLVNHANVVRLFAATEEWFKFSNNDVWTLFHSYAFDFSVWEMWGALLHGGRLVVVPYWISRSPEAFYNLLCKEQVTILNQTPSAFRQLMYAEEQVSHSTEALALRLVIFGGEALEIKSLEPWFERHGDRMPQLVNMYGITETTVHVTYHPLTQRDLNRTNSVIGRPIPDLQVYLLDQHRQLVPVGVPGEMYIGGAGVAQGYLNRPELSAERFISHSFETNSTKLYKTGDLARYLLNGELEYLGRIDQQVKVRGFRIELGEIEAVLHQHPAIQEAIVIVREVTSDKHQESINPVHPLENTASMTSLRQFLKPAASTNNFLAQQLLAYCVVRQQPAPTITELRRWLLTQLPEYMIPSAFVMLADLPLTPNGKVDRRALPEPDEIRPELETAYVAPSNSVQKALTEVWAQVLGIERVGIHDNFFELGGDSIRSIQVLAKCQERGLSFSLQQLFQHQTIYQLAQEVIITEPSSSAVTKTEKFSLIAAQDRQKLPNNVEDAYPLARIQAGVIFHSQYSPDSPMYHDIFFYHLRVRLDIERFQQAIQQLVDRHPILRTSFDLINFTEPLQLVHRTVPVPVQVEDLRSLSPTQQEEAIATWIETEKKRHFDWTCPPMIRFFIHRLTDESFYVVLSFHDCILDGWSTASLLTELLHRYWALLYDQVYPLELPPTVTYRDFVALERATLESKECRNYWTQTLNDSIIIQLPRWFNTYNRSKNPQIGVLDVPISSEISDGLKKLARIAEVPLKDVLLAAHIRVMSLLSGESDVLTGLESNGRLETEDAEQTLGVHLNTVPFRLQLTGGTWIDLVQQVFQTERELLPFRRYPYADLKKLNGGEHLFETVFNYTHFHVFQNLQSLNGLEILGAQGFGETHFALRVEFNREPFSDNIQLDLECDLTKINNAQLEAIASYYIETLTVMSQKPNEHYESQCLLPVAEQHKLLVEWNNTATEYPHNWSIHQWFEAQVLRTPDAIAVVCEGQQLSYQQLNERSNQLAQYLQNLGVNPDIPVGICVERSLEMVVGILGILKAGGAYLPLDPAYPQEHFNFILQDAQVLILLTQEHLVAKFSTHSAQIVCLDANWEIIARGSIDNPVNRTTPENLAYIIYTSGSTGKPKGVKVTHRNLVHSTSARITYYTERVSSFLLVPSFAFDSSVAVIFWTLCQGGTLVLPKQGTQRDIWELAKAIAQHKISHWLSVPSLYNALLTHVQPAQLSSLRTVIVAGEPCSQALVKHHYQLLPQTSLFNEYGPTEATVWSSVCNCLNYESSNIIPIGRPIANTQIYLLDAHLQPVPIGVVGELYIGGLGIVNGYLNRPELTAQKFISNPFENSKSRSVLSEAKNLIQNSKLYKTGDLARYLPDGNIEFLGRQDYQVKIRGYRIELEEIEAVLKQHPDVRDAVVVVTEEESGNKRLAAYVVAAGKSTPTNRQLRTFLKQKLPEYMTPNTFVMLDTLPLTPSGKVDRRRLPAPNQKPIDETKMAEILRKLKQISEEEAKQLLSQKKLSISERG